MNKAGREFSIDPKGIGLLELNNVASQVTMLMSPQSNTDGVEQVAEEKIGAGKIQF